MKITIQPPEPGQEDEIILRCSRLDDRLMALIYALSTERIKLTAYSDGGITMLDPKDVYYFESVDDRVFAYCEKQVYEVRKKLYELEKELVATDFLRISKSTVADVSKFERLKPSFNGRLEAKLKNGETIIVSRQYVPALKQKLGF